MMRSAHDPPNGHSASTQPIHLTPPKAPRREPEKATACQSQLPGSRWDDRSRVLAAEGNSRAVARPTPSGHRKGRDSGAQCFA
jgi:hypothetical protein